MSEIRDDHRQIDFMIHEGFVPFCRHAIYDERVRVFKNYAILGLLALLIAESIWIDIRIANDPVTIILATLTSLALIVSVLYIILGYLPSRMKARMIRKDLAYYEEFNRWP